MLFRPREILLTLSLLAGACHRVTDPHVEWNIYKGDAASTSYSGLDQINTGNVDELEIAWIFRPKDAPEGMRLPKYECNPIVVDGVMYVTSARHWIYALDAATGEKIWQFDPFGGVSERRIIKRGVTFWRSDNDCRLLFTAGEKLFAVNATNGEPVVSFGKEGQVRLDEGLGVDPDSVWVVPTSPGIVFEDLLIVGSEVSELYDAAPGHIRAYHIPTGKVAWTFNTIPQPGEFGSETWPEGAWEYAGGANNWGGMSLDLETGIVYVPLGSPTYDYYGANRIGQNLYGNCLVALNARTGQRIWHFQTVHHDLWDYDLPSPPNLVTVQKDGRPVDAVAQTTKTGFLFVLDRMTGEPLFPVEERAVPASRIPGEETWPTQPFPQKPAPYSRQVMTEDDLTSFTPADYDYNLRRFREYRFEGMFTPPDTRGTILIPGSRGGSEWGGGAFDPATGILYVNANESPEIAKMEQAGRRKRFSELTPFELGERLFTSYCVACHGADRAGTEPDFPSLVGVKDRITREQVVDLVKNGKGKMPGFGGVLEGYEAAIVAYLFDLETTENIQALEQKTDSTAGYFNVSAYSYFHDAADRPAIKPPWGTLSAIDLNSGEYVWRIPLGNYAELQGPGEPETGAENFGGPIVTAGGLVFIAATRDEKMRAFDKRTGKLLWETALSGGGYAIPSTYIVNGIQYLTIAVSSSESEPGGHLQTYSLPQ